MEQDVQRLRSELGSLQRQLSHAQQQQQQNALPSSTLMSVERRQKIETLIVLK